MTIESDFIDSYLILLKCKKIQVHESNKHIKNIKQTYKKLQDPGEMTKKLLKKFLEFHFTVAIQNDKIR